MRDTQPEYGSRLREFHARHGITPDPDRRQRALFLLEPKKQRRQRRILLWIAGIILGTAALITFEILAIEYTWVEFIDGPPTPAQVQR